jgi:Trk K+ transport system NAD-binding subunit
VAVDDRARADQSRADLGHLVVCGDDLLAFRIVEELTIRYGEKVTVILPSAQRGYGPKIARLPRVRLIERAELDHQAFLAAELRGARALALVGQNDLGNFHAALRAQELNADLRLVVASFNMGLGERIGAFFSDCAVLSESWTAAPSFVAAALSEPAPSHVGVAGRTIYVTRREQAGPGHVICGLSEDPGRGSPRLADPQDGSSELVLAVADGTPRNPLVRQRPRPIRAVTKMVRGLFWNKMGIAFASMIGFLFVGFALVRVAPHTWSDSLYLTLLDAAGDAVTNSSLTWTEKIAQFVLTIDGLAFLPLVTALIVSSRLPVAQRTDRPVSDHVIVAGLGNVGTRVFADLNDLGVDVVCVDRNENAAGVQLARRLGVKVVIGETHSEGTLLAAGITTCQSLVSVTSSDTVNLETALVARALAERPRIVLRLGDDDLAERIDERVGNTISRSVPYLAAPSFAAAMLEHQVLCTIPMGRHVLLIAEVAVGAGAELAGARVDDVHDGSDNVRLIALRPRGGTAADWSPRPDARLTTGDRLVVLATRAGLGRVLARSRSR